MPVIKVLIKGLNKIIEFPTNTPMPDIERHIQGNWSSVEEMSGLPMDKASRMERAKYMGLKTSRREITDTVGKVIILQTSQQPQVFTQIQQLKKAEILM